MRLRGTAIAVKRRRMQISTPSRSYNHLSEWRDGAQARTEDSSQHPSLDCSDDPTPASIPSSSTMNAPSLLALRQT